MKVYNIIMIAVVIGLLIAETIWYFREKRKGLKPHESKIKAIRYFSEMNPWIDFCVVCKEKDSEAVQKAITQGMDDFWDGEYVPFGDCVEQSIENAELSYLIIYADLDYDNDTDVIYEFIVESLNPYVLK